MLKKFQASKVVAWAIIVIAVLVTLFPFYWMIRTAITPQADLIAESTRLWPSHPTMINFKRILGLVSVEEAMAAGGSGATINFAIATTNSLIYAGGIAIIQTFFASCAAYAFARLKFPFKNTLFACVIGALMIPGIFSLLPNYVLIKQLGWLNTMQGMMLPALFMAPFSIFFLRQFFLSLPREVEEAAMLDGLGPVRRFFKVTIPMSAGPIMTMTLITIIGMWKDFLWPLLTGREGAQLLTVALGIFQQQSPNRAPDWTGLMAGSTLSVIPVLILLILMGRKLVESLNFSGIK